MIFVESIVEIVLVFFLLLGKIRSVPGVEEPISVLQSVVGKNFDFTIPPTTFNSSDSSPINYDVVNSSLPSWIDSQKTSAGVIYKSIGEFYTACDDAFLSSNFAYFACNYFGVLIFEVTENGAILISSYYTGRVSTCLHVEGKIRYTFDGGSNLDARVLTLDIVDPYEPKYMGEIEVGVLFPEGLMKYNDGFLYVPGGSAGLIVFNVTNPYNPSYLSTESDARAEYIDNENDFLYVSGEYLGSPAFSIVNYTDKANPSVIGSETLFSRGKGIAYRNGFVYVCDPGYAFRVFNVTDPSNIDETKTDLSLTSCVNIQVSENDEFMFICSQSYIKIYNLSDPSDPEFIHDSADYVFCNQMYISPEEKLAVIGGGGNGLEIFNVSQYVEEPPKQILSRRDMGSFNHISYCDDYLFVFDSAFVITAFYVSDVYNPKVAGIFNLGSSRGSTKPGQSMMTDEQCEYLYMAEGVGSGFGVTVYRLTKVPNTFTLEIEHVTTFPQYSYGLDIVEDTIYVAGSDGLTILDITNRETPTQLSELEDYPNAHDIIHVSGTYAYVGTQAGTIGCYDVTLPGTPVYKTAFATSSLKDLKAQDGYVFACSSITGLTVIDWITDVMAPNEVGSLGMTCGQIRLQGELAYVLNENCLEVINITDKTDPFVVDTFDICTTYYKLDSKGPIAIFGVGSDGFRILGMSEGLNIQGTPTECSDEEISLEVTDDSGTIYYSLDIEVRKVGYFDENCTVYKCNDILSNSGEVCEGHGNCYFDPPNGYCNCDRFYVNSSFCMDCEDGYGHPGINLGNSKLCIPVNWTCNGVAGNASNVCSGHGYCDYHTETCFCNENYFGIDCNITYCYEILGNWSSVCTDGQGDCVDIDTCSCHEKFYGEECEVHTCFGELSNDTDIVCSGHGNCSTEDSCDCMNGYVDQNCVTTCFGYLSNETSVVCSAHGDCITPDNCFCNLGYFEETCNITSCSGVFNNESDVCLKRGDCRTKDKCDCWGEYLGDNCENYECYGVDYDDDEVCSGERGDCIGPNNCSCYEKWVGESCQHFSCFNKSLYAVEEKLRIDVCGGHGDCISVDICKCDIGYSASVEDGICDMWYCDNIEKSMNETVCTGHGDCLSPELCQCGEGYTGEYCEYHSCEDTVYTSTTVCNSRGACIGPNECICNQTSSVFGITGMFCDIKFGKSLVRATSHVFVLNFEMDKEKLSSQYNIQVDESFECSRLASVLDAGLEYLFVNNCSISKMDEFDDSSDTTFLMKFYVPESHISSKAMQQILTRNQHTLQMRVYDLPTTISVLPSKKKFGDVEKKQYTLRTFSKGEISSGDDGKPASENEVCKSKLHFGDSCIKVFECYQSLETDQFTHFSIGFMPSLNNQFFYTRFYFHDHLSCSAGNDFDHFRRFVPVSCTASPYDDQFVLYERCSEQISGIFLESAVLGLFLVSSVPFFIAIFLVGVLSVCCLVNFLCFGGRLFCIKCLCMEKYFGGYRRRKVRRRNIDEELQTLVSIHEDDPNSTGDEENEPQHSGYTTQDIVDSDDVGKSDFTEELSEVEEGGEYMANHDIPNKNEESSAESTSSDDDHLGDYEKTSTPYNCEDDKTATQIMMSNNTDTKEENHQFKKFEEEYSSLSNNIRDFLSHYEHKIEKQQQQQQQQEEEGEEGEEENEGNFTLSAKKYRSVERAYQIILDEKKLEEERGSVEVKDWKKENRRHVQVFTGKRSEKKMMCGSKICDLICCACCCCRYYCCPCVTRYLKSIVMLLVILLKDAVMIWFSTSEFLDDSGIDTSNPEYILLKTVMATNMYLIWICIFLYLVFLVMMIIWFVGRFHMDPIMFCVSVGSLKEYVFYRVYKGLWLVWFICINLFCYVVLFWYLDPYEKDKQISSASFWFNIIFPELLLVFTLLEVLGYNGVSSHSHRERLQKLGWVGQMRFPKVNIGWQMVAKDVDVILEDFFQILYLIDMPRLERTRSREYVDELARSNEYGHLSWVFLDGLTADEILYLKDFFFPQKEFHVEESYWTVFHHHKLTSAKWWIAVLFFPVLCIVGSSLM